MSISPFGLVNNGSSGLINSVGDGLIVEQGKLYLNVPVSKLTYVTQSTEDPQVTSIRDTNNRVFKLGELWVNTNHNTIFMLIRKYYDDTVLKHEWKQISYKNTVIATYAPTIGDTNYDIGQIWLDSTTEKGYILTSKVGNLAYWKIITNTTSDTLPAMTVDPTESSIVVRNMSGSGHFTGLFLHDFPSLDTQNKVLSTTGQYGEVVSKSLDFTNSNFVCNTLQVTKLTSLNVSLTTDINGNIIQSKNLT